MSDLADWPDSPAERARELVEGVLDELDLDGDVEIEEDDDRIVVTVVGGDDYGLLIGKRGQTIDALQLLCYQAAFRGLRDRKRVVVDAAGYRGRRKETLESRADRAAEQALNNNRVVEMDPMSAQERRVVHERLKGRSGSRQGDVGRHGKLRRGRQLSRDALCDGDRFAPPGQAK